MAEQIRIELTSNNNAVFQGPTGHSRWDRDQQLAGVLRQAADYLTNSRVVENKVLRDVNGNQCGTLTVYEDGEDCDTE